MRFVGFIKEQDQNINNARKLAEMFQGTKISEGERMKIVEYLDNGVFLCGVMSYIYDDSGNPIGNLDYFTDGEFIWPVYFSYYLKKYPDFYIDEFFVEFVQSNMYEMNKISDEKLVEIERIFDKEWARKL